MDIEQLAKYQSYSKQPVTTVTVSIKGATSIYGE